MVNSVLTKSIKKEPQQQTAIGNINEWENSEKWKKITCNDISTEYLSSFQLLAVQKSFEERMVCPGHNLRYILFSWMVSKGFAVISFFFRGLSYFNYVFCEESAFFFILNLVSCCSLKQIFCWKSKHCFLFLMFHSFPLQIIYFPNSSVLV